MPNLAREHTGATDTGPRDPARLVRWQTTERRQRPDCTEIAPGDALLRARAPAARAAAHKRLSPGPSRWAAPAARSWRARAPPPCQTQLAEPLASTACAPACVCVRVRVRARARPRAPVRACVRVSSTLGGRVAPRARRARWPPPRPVSPLADGWPCLCNNHPHGTTTTGRRALALAPGGSRALARLATQRARAPEPNGSPPGAPVSPAPGTHFSCLGADRRPAGPAQIDRLAPIKRAAWQPKRASRGRTRRPLGPGLELQPGPHTHAKSNFGLDSDSLLGYLDLCPAIKWCPTRPGANWLRFLCAALAPAAALQARSWRSLVELGRANWRAQLAAPVLPVASIRRLAAPRPADQQVRRAPAARQPAESPGASWRPRLPGARPPADA